MASRSSTSPSAWHHCGSHLLVSAFVSSPTNGCHYSQYLNKSRISCTMIVIGLVLICSSYDFRRAHSHPVSWWRSRLMNPLVGFFVFYAYPEALVREPMGYNNHKPSLRALCNSFLKYWPAFWVSVSGSPTAFVVYMGASTIFSWLPHFLWIGCQKLLRKSNLRRRA